MTTNRMNAAIGSRNSDDDFDSDGKPRWDAKTELKREHDYHHADGSYAYTLQKGINSLGEEVWRTIRKNMLPFSDRLEPEDQKSHWPGKGDAPWVLYHLPELIEAAKTTGALVVVCEGEKDVDAARALGCVATCNPCGALKWLDEFSPFLTGCRVAIVPDNDPRGRWHADQVARSVVGVAQSVVVVELPDLKEKGDLSDWVGRRKAAGETGEDIAGALQQLIDHASPWDGDAIDPNNPMGAARRFLTDQFPEVDGVATLRHWQGEWYEWTGPCWRTIEPSAIEAELYAWLEKQRHWLRAVAGNPPTLVKVKPKIALISEVSRALKALVLVRVEVEAPAWLVDQPGDWVATEMMSVENGLVHLPTGEVKPHTPRLFAINSIQAGWDRDAWASGAEPIEFLGFLRSIIKEHADAQIALLQEMFGYLLTPDTKHQTGFMLIGPKRSGKGTIGRILERLHAKDYVSPSVNALGTRFGKQSLIGKTIAVVADVRIGSKTDLGHFAETILSITGEDPQTVERKGITDWQGHLRTRFLFMANDLPRFQDKDSVLASRFYYIATDVSYWGREDRGMTDKLWQQSGLILLWAVRGWQRLEANKRFTETPVHRTMLVKAETIMKPIRAFVNECCELGPDKQETTQALYNAFTLFCEENGVGHFTDNAFAMRLHEEVKGLQSARLRDGQQRQSAKTGIALKPEWRASNEEPL